MHGGRGSGEDSSANGPVGAYSTQDGPSKSGASHATAAAAAAAASPLPTPLMSAAATKPAGQMSQPAVDTFASAPKQQHSSNPLGADVGVSPDAVDTAFPPPTYQQQKNMDAPLTGACVCLPVCVCLCVFLWRLFDNHKGD